MRVRISPNEILDRGGMRQLFSIKDATISREVRLGRLRPSMVSGRQLFTGKAIMAWLETKAAEPDTADDQGDE